MIVTCPDCGYVEQVTLGGRGHNCTGPQPRKVTEAEFRALMDHLGIEPNVQESIESARLAQEKE